MADMKLTAAIEGHNEAGRHLLLRAETAERNEAHLTAQLAEARAELGASYKAQDAFKQMALDEAGKSIELEDKLAEERALLGRCADDGGMTWSLEKDINEYLLANPEPPRAAAERAVLDTMRDWPSDSLLADESRIPMPLRPACRAELARRAVRSAEGKP